MARPRSTTKRDAKEIKAMNEIEALREQSNEKDRAELAKKYQRERQQAIRTQRKEPYRPFLN